MGSLLDRDGRFGKVNLSFDFSANSQADVDLPVHVIRYGRIVKPSFEMGARLMPMVDGRLKTDTHQLAQNLITFENNCKLCAEATRRFKTSIDALVHAGRIVHQDFVGPFDFTSRPSFVLLSDVSIL